MIMDPDHHPYSLSTPTPRPPMAPGGNPHGHSTGNHIPQLPQLPQLPLPSNFPETTPRTTDAQGMFSPLSTTGPLNGGTSPSSQASSGAYTHGGWPSPYRQHSPATYSHVVSPFPQDRSPLTAPNVNYGQRSGSASENVYTGLPASNQEALPPFSSAPAFANGLNSTAPSTTAMPFHAGSAPGPGLPSRVLGSSGSISHVPTTQSTTLPSASPQPDYGFPTTTSIPHTSSFPAYSPGSSTNYMQQHRSPVFQKALPSRIPSGMAPPNLEYGGGGMGPVQGTGRSSLSYSGLPGPMLSNVGNPGHPMSTLMPGMGIPSYFAGPGGMPGYGHHGDPSPLQKHQDRPFRCDECTTSFNRNHDLKRHKRIHLAVKPFPCGYCDKSFSRKDALKRHRLVKLCGGEEGSRKSRSRSGSPQNTGHVSDGGGGPVRPLTQ